MNLFLQSSRKISKRMGKKTGLSASVVNWIFANMATTVGTTQLTTSLAVVAHFSTMAHHSRLNCWALGSSWDHPGRGSCRPDCYWGHALMTTAIGAAHLTSCLTIVTHFHTDTSHSWSHWGALFYRLIIFWDFTDFVAAMWTTQLTFAFALSKALILNGTNTRNYHGQIIDWTLT